MLFLFRAEKRGGAKINEMLPKKKLRVENWYALLNIYSQEEEEEEEEYFLKKRNGATIPLIYVPFTSRLWTDLRNLNPKR